MKNIELSEIKMTRAGLMKLSIDSFLFGFGVAVTYAVVRTFLNSIQL